MDSLPPTVKTVIPIIRIRIIECICDVLLLENANKKSP
ncbi:hypothetical protein MKHDV_03523 [Halodesulfovibrio sp. MK-HDV]|nr:hypothetical protein MKHDV_03523 [Halodesulfovibrio sp. MK-HDV]